MQIKHDQKVYMSTKIDTAGVDRPDTVILAEINFLSRKKWLQGNALVTRAGALVSGAGYSPGAVRWRILWYAEEPLGSTALRA